MNVKTTTKIIKELHQKSFGEYFNNLIIWGILNLVYYLFNLIFWKMKYFIDKKSDTNQTTPKGSS